MHRAEDDVIHLGRNRMRSMFHDQFDAHPIDDSDRMEVEVIDQADNHEECSTRTYLQQSLAFVVRSWHLHTHRSIEKRESLMRVMHTYSQGNAK